VQARCLHHLLVGKPAACPTGDLRFGIWGESGVRGRAVVGEIGPRMARMGTNGRGELGGEGRGRGGGEGEGEEGEGEGEGECKQDACTTF
jgi:hypothetical protein